MLGDIERLRRELARISRPRSAVITPTTDRPPLEMTVGDTIAFDYEGEARCALVQAILPWGIRGRDMDKLAVRSFRFDRMAAASVTSRAAT